VTEPRRPRPPRRSRRGLIAAGVVLALLLLAVGIAIGESLKDNPKPNLTVTTTKTIIP
jgi:hypothetical protein